VTVSEQRGPRRVPVVALVAAGVVAGVALIAWQASRMVAARADAAERAFQIERSNVAAPPLALTTFDGGRFSLDQAKGQVVFVNFWATWCPPCREEMPSMAQLGADLEARHPGKFKMVAVSVDEGWAEIATFFGGKPPPGVTVTLDHEQITTQAWYCAARGGCPDSLKFPESYIVGKDGRLVAYIVGPRDWRDPSATRFLERLITE
jgi:thiol-disulfide isomerase/thioredoxin